jgi:hypothetical protein
VLADLEGVQDGFEMAFKETKEELARNGCILPTLEANMRNQVNIANIKIVEGGENAMQSSINKLTPASSVVGEMPVIFNSKYGDWDNKKESILKHVINIMETKNTKNIAILHDETFKSEDIENTLKDKIEGKTIVTYPSSCKNKIQNIENVKKFCEQNNHILVTKNKYFDGCEASNVIFINFFEAGVRHTLMRAVQNVIYIYVGGGVKITGMKENNTFC